MELIIYYKNRKTSNFVMKNNLSATKKLQFTNVVYKFTCPKEDCAILNKMSYIDRTTTTFVSPTEWLIKGSFSSDSRQKTD